MLLAGLGLRQRSAQFTRRLLPFSGNCLYASLPARAEDPPSQAWEEPAVAAVPERWLLREFIQNSLYHPTKGFFNAHVPVVGQLHKPINYWKIYCQEEYKIVVNQKYKELEVSFLTPAELFHPWYGYILARHIFEHRKHNLLQEGLPLHIIEIGGGNGTLARDILDWIRTEKPEEYESTSYTCVEISTRLALQQYDTVVAKGGHHNRFHMVQGNAWARATWGLRDYQHTFVLMMEVLDNLPHDRVVRKNARQPWQQTVVTPADPSVNPEDAPWLETTEPLADPLVQRCIDAVYRPPTLEDRLDSRFNKLLDFILARESMKEVEDEIVFVPTACMALMDILHDARPNHSLIAADFDKLPDVKIPGRNAPLVAEKVGGQNIDHDSLYVPWGKADIFFPTDFDALARIYAQSADHVWGAGTGVVKTAHYRQGAVMKRYREMFKTATICSFNPMIDDFLNARFFFGDSYKRTPPAAQHASQELAQIQHHTQQQQQWQQQQWQQQSKPPKEASPPSSSSLPKPTLSAAMPSAAPAPAPAAQKPADPAAPTVALPPPPSPPGAAAANAKRQSGAKPATGPAALQSYQGLPLWAQKKLQQQQQQQQQQDSSEPVQPGLHEEPVLGGRKLKAGKPSK